MKHWMLTLALAALCVACEAEEKKTEEAPKAVDVVSQQADDRERAAKARAVVEAAKRREAAEAPDPELSEEEEKQIRETSAAEVDEKNVEAVAAELEAMYKTLK